MEGKEEFKPRKEQERESLQRMKQMERDLSILVTNTQIASDAKVVLQRKLRAKTQAQRAVLLENDLSSSQEKSDEILRGQFENFMNRKGIPGDLQKALMKQQQLYDTMIQDKLKLINELQQELKLKSDNYASTLRKNAEEINLMISRMEDQIKMMTNVYREELVETERRHQQEISIFLTKDKEELERELKKFWDEELERLTERKKNLDHYRKEIHEIGQESNHIYNALDFEKCSRNLAQQREQKKNENINILLKMKKTMHTEKEEILLVTLKNIKSRITREERQIEKLKKIYTDKKKEFLKQSRALLDYKHYIQKYERIKKQVKHFAVADAKRFEEVWLVIEDEVKQLAQRALTIESVISQQLFGLPWKEPDLSHFKLSSPFRPRKPTPEVSQPSFQTRKSSQGMMDGSAESNVESPDMTVITEETVGSFDCGPEWEEETLPEDMQKQIRQLLCNETDFLTEAKVLKLLTPLVTEEQTGVKLGSLLYTLGIDENDLPQLADFLLKYMEQQSVQTEKTEDACKTNVKSSSSEFIHPNHILPALKSFLEQQNSRKSSVQELLRLWLAHARDSSKDAAYWESLGNIIPEEKVKLWDATERTLMQYHAVLTDISDLNLKTEHLREENIKLRMNLNSQLNK
ncbi:dynein regulatory complex protein 1 [Anableps anableps]